MKCNKCGNKVLYGEKFCPKCGNAISINNNYILKMKNLIKTMPTKIKVIITLIIVATIIITFTINGNNMKENKSNKQTELDTNNLNNEYTEKRISLFDVRRYTYIDYVTDIMTEVGYDKTSNAYGKHVVKYITISRIRPEKNKEKFPELLYVYEIMYPYNPQKTIPRYAYITLDDLLQDIYWAGEIYSYLQPPNTYTDWKEYDRKDDTNTNSDNKKDDDTTNNDNKEYYTPIQVSTNQGIYGMYKDNTETKKYVIQDETIEYWEDQYIYLGTYKQEDNKLCIEYSSRYKYDETENKYVLAGGGYTTMFKLGKDYEELTIKSEEELVTSNGVKYLKEYPSNNTNNSIFSSKPSTYIQKEQEPITQIETPKLVKTYNTIKSEGKTEYNIIKILQYENGDYTYEIYWHSYGETTPSTKSKERFKTIDETLKSVIQNFEGYKLTMNDLTEE